MRVDLIDERISYIAVEGTASNKEPAATNAAVRVREQISSAILYGDLPLLLNSCDDIACNAVSARSPVGVEGGGQRVEKQVESNIALERSRNIFRSGVTIHHNNTN